jgi:hypothetical protein
VNLDESGQEREDADEEAQVEYLEQENEATENQRDIPIRVDGHNNPINDPEKGDDAREESEHKTVI